MKKIIIIDQRAEKEIDQFSVEVQIKITATLEVLAIEGFLKEPYAKRIDEEIFEIRIKHKGQYRALYAYLKGRRIIILSAFQKKRQKTAKK